MIKVKIYKTKGIIDCIKISGHADYATYGYDIVCSAVSSVVTTSINAILSFEKTIDVIDKETLEIKVLKHDRITTTLIENMIAMLKEIEKQYKENIRTEEKNEC